MKLAAAILILTLCSGCRLITYDLETKDGRRAKVRIVTTLFDTKVSNIEYTDPEKTLKISNLNSRAQIEIVEAVAAGVAKGILP